MQFRIFLVKSVLLRREHTEVNKVCNPLNPYLLKALLPIPFDKLPWQSSLSQLLLNISTFPSCVRHSVSCPPLVEHTWGIWSQVSYSVFILFLRFFKLLNYAISIGWWIDKNIGLFLYVPLLIRRGSIKVQVHFDDLREVWSRRRYLRYHSYIT